MGRKVLLMIADGLGDWPYELLDNQTPLQYATTPHLDRIASNGMTGLMDLYQAGIPVGTDLGHLTLFGYLYENYPGRGPVEAAGKGIQLFEGDVAFRCNFGTIDEDRVVINRRAGRIRQGAKELAEALNDIEVEGVKVIFKEATEHRAVLVLRGTSLSDQITDTDPKKEGIAAKKARPIDDSFESKRTADILNKVREKFEEILKDHPINQKRVEEGLLPANTILTRGSGKLTNMPKITERLNFTACCIASEKTVLGAATLAGFDIRTDLSFTGNIDTNIEKKAAYAVEALKSYDFVALHYKAADLMGHDGNIEGKVQAINRYDELAGYVLKGIEQEINDEVIIGLAADHSTPCARYEHSGDPVPVVISGKVIRKDKVTQYHEIACGEGSLNRISGPAFTTSLLDYLEKTIKRGS